MSATYNAPGVHVEEIATLPNSVAQVATAVPAFVGYTETDPGEPRRITSMVDFEAVFGGADTYSATTGGLAVIIDSSEASGVVTNSITSVTETVATKFKLYYSMQLYFANGGGPCWVASAGQYPANASSMSASDLNDALDLLAYEDEPTLLLAPDATGLDTAANCQAVFKHALQQANDLQDRFVIIDTFTGDETAGEVTTFRTQIGTNYLKYGAAYYPHLKTNINYPDSAIKVTSHTNTTGTLPSGWPDLDASPYQSLADIKEDQETESEIALILAEIGGDLAGEIRDISISLPPSGAIAGVMCAVDRNRGVWKAPANVSLNGVLETEVKVDEALAGTLNVDPDAGKSINAIRTFTGKGHLVYGARTLAGNDNEWRYVPVRRLYITAEESIRKATAFSVFEPNDANTWLKLRSMIENYLSGLWRQGALAGAKPEDAFFVRVGLGETMTNDDILNGNLNIEIGMAAVRPAEFIILKFSHKLQEA